MGFTVCGTHAARRGAVDLAGAIGADAQAKLGLDEGVVDQVGHVLEGLPVVFTDDTGDQSHVIRSFVLLCFPYRDLRMPSLAYVMLCSVIIWQVGGLSSPPVEAGLTELHHEHWHLIRGQDQQHLWWEGRGAGQSPGMKSLLSSSFSTLFFSVHVVCVCVFKQK